MRIAKPLAVVVSLFIAAGAVAADKGEKYPLQPTDTVRSVLEKAAGQPVKLRLRSGSELAGTVVRLGTGVVQLTDVGGMEYYDAVVNIDDIATVLIKVRKR